MSPLSLSFECPFVCKSSIVLCPASLLTKFFLDWIHTKYQKHKYLSFFVLPLYVFFFFFICNQGLFSSCPGVSFNPSFLFYYSSVLFIFISDFQSQFFSLCFSLILCCACKFVLASSVRSIVRGVLL